MMANVPEAYTEEDFRNTSYLREALAIVDKFRDMRKATQRAEYLAKKIEEIVETAIYHNNLP